MLFPSDLTNLPPTWRPQRSTALHAEPFRQDRHPTSAHRLDGVHRMLRRPHHDPGTSTGKDLGRASEASARFGLSGVFAQSSVKLKDMLSRCPYNQT